MSYNYYHYKKAIDENDGDKIHYILRHIMSYRWDMHIDFLYNVCVNKDLSVIPYLVNAVKPECIHKVFLLLFENKHYDGLNTLMDQCYENNQEYDIDYFVKVACDSDCKELIIFLLSKTKSDIDAVTYKWIPFVLNHFPYKIYPEYIYPENIYYQTFTLRTYRQRDVENVLKPLICHDVLNYILKPYIMYE